MNTPPKKSKQSGKPSADSGKVIKFLAEARQVVDDLGGGSAAAAPSRKKKTPASTKGSPRSRVAAGAAKKPASRPKAPTPSKGTPTRKTQPPAAKAKGPAQIAAKPAPAPAPAPLLSPRECGISVVHSLPGRIRFRIRSLQFDGEFAQEVEAKLAAIKGITEVGASPSTGSLLISYSSKKVVAPPLGNALKTWFPGLDSESLLAEMLD